MLLILSEDINLNLGPVNRHQIEDHKFKYLPGKDYISFTLILTFYQKDELRYIAKNSNAAVIGISKIKLDNTIYDSAVAIIKT